MGHRLRSSRADPAAGFGVSEVGPGKRRLGLFVGLRFSTAPLERGGKQMERDASSVYAPERRRYRVTERSKESSRDPRGSLRRCFKRRGDRRWQYSNSRAAVAGKNVQRAGG